MTRPTPLTDAVLTLDDSTVIVMHGQAGRLAEHARTLERQLADTREALKEALDGWDALEEECGVPPYAGYRKRIAELRRLLEGK